MIDGVMDGDGNETVQVDAHNQELRFYIPANGPCPNTPENAKNLWGKSYLCILDDRVLLLVEFIRGFGTFELLKKTGWSSIKIQRENNMKGFRGNM